MKKNPHEQFNLLLEKYNAGTLTPQEKALMEEWIEVLGEQESEHSLTEQDKLELKSKLRSYIQKTKKQPEAPTIAIRPWYATPLKVAASLLLLATLSFFVWQISQRTISEKPAIVQAVSSGVVKKVMLSDGSIVWLKGVSTITYPTAFEGKERLVTLTGEALFEVAKDPEYPFIIHSGELITRVLGTSFNIKNTPEATEIFVLTGKVSVTSTQTQRVVELLPAQKIVYANTTHQWEELEKEPETTSLTYSKGTEYNMKFKNTSIADIARQIEAKFNVTIEMDEEMASCSITADFTDQSLTYTLDLLAELINASYSADGSTITMEGGGCE